MKLRVQAGAKEGAEIALKKPNFLIGRSAECSLRAASDAISRRHCQIELTDSGYVVSDLGSRNGTFVNDVAIQAKTPLRDGDTLRVGPLVFLVVGDPAAAPEKKPPVANVAEAVARASAKADGKVEEDDISRWLLGDPNGSRTLSSRETMTFRFDETQSVNLTPASAPLQSEAAPPPAEEDEEASAEADKGDEDPADDKKKGKKSVGKLPKIPTKPLAKDSREAAAEILRGLSRRR